MSGIQFDFLYLAAAQADREQKPKTKEYHSFFDDLWYFLKWFEHHFRATEIKATS